MDRIVEYDFPAVVRAAKPHSRTERPVVCLLRGRSVLREISNAEAPVAAIVKRRQARSKFRSYGDGLFTTVANFDRIGDLVGSNRFLRRTGIEQRLFREAAVALADFRETQIWPEGVKFTLDMLRLMAPIAHEATDLFRHSNDRWDDLRRLANPETLNKTENTDADIAERIAYADAVVTESVMVCEKSILSKSPDPCIAVTPYNAAHGMRGVQISQGDITFYERAGTMPGLNAKALDLYWREMCDACFPITHFDLAREFAEELNADIPRGISTVGIVSDIERVDVFDASVFTHDFSTSELKRLADRVFYHGTRATRLPSRTNVLRKNVPEDFIEALLEFEAAFDPETGDLDQIEEALEGMISAVAANRDGLEALSIDTGNFVRSIENGLEHWNGRPIKLETETGLFGNWKTGHPD